MGGRRNVQPFGWFDAGPRAMIFAAGLALLKIRYIRNRLFFLGLAAGASFLFPLWTIHSQAPDLSPDLQSKGFSMDSLGGRNGQPGPADLQTLLNGQKKTDQKISIENASEGEFIKGEQDEEKGLLILRGRIRVRLPGGVFTANTVIIDATRQELYGEGNLVYRSTKAKGPYTEIRGERLIYDQRLGTGILYNASGYMEPLYFIGESVQQIGAMKFAVSHAIFTGCAAQRPHYNFSARKLWIYPDRRIVAVGVLYHVGGVPLLPLPFLYASDWGTGVISQFGHSTVQGYYWQNTYQFSDPSAFFSSWRPTAYRFTADWYENTGEAGGVELYKFTPNLNYVLQGGVAGYKRYEIIPDYREKNDIRVTNNVTRADGTVGEDNYHWRRAFAIVNYRNQDHNSNMVRNVHLRYEDYTNQMYDFEFGARYQPTSTIPALYHNSEAGRGIVHSTTNWNLVYNESRDDLNIRVEASRDRRWLQESDPLKSHYIPLTDVVPSVDIRKNFLIGRDPLLDLPFYWDNSLHTDVKKEYSGGQEFRTRNFDQYVSGIRTFWSMYPYITVSPSGGYGAQKLIPRDPNAAEDRNAKLQSYEFYYTRDQVTLGPDLLFLRALYTKKDSFNEEAKYNPPINPKAYDPHQRVNETELSLETNPLENLHMSVTSVYDMKKYEQDVKPNERWSYPVWRSDLYFDFINGFSPSRENLMSRNRVHFMGLRLTNDYIYDSIKKRDHSDVAGASFEAGGFDLWLLRRLRYLELSYYWYHVYYNPTLDHMRFSAKLDVQLTRFWFFQMELESRATDISRYSQNSTNSSGQSDYIAFEQDVVNGTGVNGAKKRQNSVFNLGYFEGAFVVDLHDWEFRFGYSVEQRSLLGGTNSVDVVNFYDNRVFVSATLLRFDVQSVGRTPSRFLINRRRVRPSDVGVVPNGRQVEY